MKIFSKIKILNFCIILISFNFNLISSYPLIDINDYSFKAIYHSEVENENVALFGVIPGDINKMLIDEQEVEPSKEYIFPKIGKHSLYVLMNISSSTSLAYMFNGVKKLDSIIFTSKFNTENITSFTWMFYGCLSLSSIDMSSFNTNSLIYMNRMFYNCQSLISVDFSNFNTTNL